MKKTRKQKQATKAPIQQAGTEYNQRRDQAKKGDTNIIVDHSAH
jgi:hypothetical protein